MGLWDTIVDCAGEVWANMDLIAFLILAVIMIASAIYVVTSEEIIHSALYLALTFVCVAVVYFFLEAEFIGVVQLMVYVGAITIMFAFSIMLTRRHIMKPSDDEKNDEECGRCG